jgi:hypothetical protein
MSFSKQAWIGFAVLVVMIALWLFLTLAIGSQVTDRAGEISRY